MYSKWVSILKKEKKTKQNKRELEVIILVGTFVALVVADADAAKIPSILTLFQETGYILSSHLS